MQIQATLVMRIEFIQSAIQKIDGSFAIGFHVDIHIYWKMILKISKDLVKLFLNII